MPQGQEITDIERQEIHQVFRKVIDVMQPNMSLEDDINVQAAFEIALEAHKRQRRKSGEPYIYHPIEVARICLEEIGLGPTAIMCALLHDVVEDTDITLPEIYSRFGPKVGKIVDGLTKLDGLYNVESAQAENFKKVLSTLVDDVRVVLIKLADRLHNMRTIDSMPIHKQLKIAAETDFIYIPLAHRLGLYKIKTELQDICLKITEPEIYKEIEAKLENTLTERTNYIKDFIEPVKDRLSEEGIEYKITGRSKAISSIYNKLKSKEVPFDEIYDIFAVRIVADIPVGKEKQICWAIYSIITDVYNPIPERLKDWVTTPKSNGYESLHTTVIGPNGKFVEVQIRSERMDEIAERGFAAHWKYKGVKSQNNVFDAWLDNIRGLLEDNDTNALEFLSDFKTNLFNEEVYVFTPKGEMKVLPKGATALDFAFEIHTDVGSRATAIKVNNKLVPMGYKLESGDQVTVVTSKNQRPNQEWLKLVVTGKARAKIRSTVKEEMKALAEYGKEQVERKLKNLRIGFEDNIDFLVRHFGYHSRVEFYFGLYKEEFNLDFKKFVIEAGHLAVKKADEVEDEPEKEKVVKKPTKKLENKSKIIVNGEPGDTYEFKFANCCSPVQGDPIFGYLTATQELKIHRFNCPNASRLLANYGYRVLKTEWEDDPRGSFNTELLITGVDSGVGVIQMLTNEISNNLGLNIRALSIEGNQGYYEGKVSIFVNNKDQLNLALKAIQKLEGVMSVVRIEKTLKTDESNDTRKA
ncbi:MAG: bifunctional (p)ppGpp synthetase/guanosine-3',5'-bis(diphosphate) 3'-pyrophosphohydrolase [Saprospiraceae bacterium]|nr:bifunctional (p)ppGpp synthetase/guanosine-3',5'-bis(diphosphate) 3'-pyrophosphohydrolase [Saprospiraceae bacterium]MBP7643439.1 bifunctional (p)ppGpp synthetase/guanosine-3',5'-bis(diphosphate) 3'-pyrophosphohydrolase [Saprospiraceae bacterium]